MFLSGESTPKRNEILTVLKLKKALEDEMLRRKLIEKQLKRAQTQLTSCNIQTEESIRASELEVENEKIRKDIVLLRNSINRGVEKSELEAQFTALEEENKRRRDECIQLRSILAQRSQHANNLDEQPLSIDANDISQAFDALKQVNRQLESELSALTAEHNSKLIESNTIIDELRDERNKLHDILQSSVLADSLIENGDNNDTDVLKNQQSVQYLLEEIKINTKSYAELMVCLYFIRV